MSRSPRRVSRRDFIAKSTLTTLAAATATGSSLWNVAAATDGHRQANGVKAGEVTATTAIVWTRLTAAPVRNNDGVVIPGKVGKGGPKKVTVPVPELEGACPGAPGRIRVRYSPDKNLRNAIETKWVDVTAKTDFIHQFALSNLKPDTRYYYTVETTGPGGSPAHGSVNGRFKTAPVAKTPSDFTFCMLTCQGYPDRGHPDGHPIHPSILKLDPCFVMFSGDNVYYDNDEPRALTMDLARYHWQRMYSLPRQFELIRNVSTYWEKDDHDTLNDDTWPGRKMGDVTFAEGQGIYREQVPIGKDMYRTIRWGRDLQVWMTEGRDFRSPNKMPDGPEKTILGQEQKEWLKRTIAASDATWKIWLSPTPIVGPDRARKNDNHSNTGFKHEGDELRSWIQAHVPDNFFVLCGDRHWQYHSVHPETGVQEFSVGAASNEHAGGSPGEDKRYHRFHRVRGGFLSVTLKPAGDQSTILFQHRSVTGKVVYEYTQTRKVTA